MRGAVGKTVSCDMVGLVNVIPRYSLSKGCSEKIMTKGPQADRCGWVWRHSTLAGVLPAAFAESLPVFRAG